jgi:hypothetical protein
MRQSAGKKTLIIASLTSASHRPTPRRDEGEDEENSATQAESTPASLISKKEM